MGVGKNFIFNFDPIEFKDPEVKKTKLAAELANGRLAMVAIIGILMLTFCVLHAISSYISYIFTQWYSNNVFHYKHVGYNIFKIFVLISVDVI